MNADLRRCGTTELEPETEVYTKDAKHAKGQRKSLLQVISPLRKGSIRQIRQIRGKMTANCPNRAGPHDDGLFASKAQDQSADDADGRRWKTAR